MLSSVDSFVFRRFCKPERPERPKQALTIQRVGWAMSVCELYIRLQLQSCKQYQLALLAVVANLLFSLSYLSTRSSCSSIGGGAGSSNSIRQSMVGESPPLLSTTRRAILHLCLYTIGASSESAYCSIAFHQMNPAGSSWPSKRVVWVSCMKQRPDKVIMCVIYSTS